MNVSLEKPNLTLFSSYKNFIDEMRNAGETIWDGMVPKLRERPEEFVARLLGDESNPETGLVPSTTYWATIQGVVVGRINLRHQLNDSLKEFGGNVGYEVHPAFRRRGIATEMLKKLLTTKKANEIGRLLVTCAPDNIASNKTIVTNGGILVASRFAERINRQTNYYWIEVSK